MTAGAATRPAPQERTGARSRWRQPATDLAVSAQLWLAAGAVEVVLRRRGLPALVAAAGRAARSPAARWFPAGRRTLGEPWLDQLVTRAGAAWRGPQGCLPRSVLRCWLAASDGRAASVVVGVRRATDTPFAAHAWAQVDGHVHASDAGPAGSFQPIATYPFTPPAPAAGAALHSEER